MIVCFHKYRKWKTISTQNLLNSHTKAVVGIAVIQEKECEKCGKIKIRVEKDILE